MDHASSLPCSQNLVTGSYAEPDGSSIHPQTIHFNIPPLRLGLPSGLFPSSFPMKILCCMHLSFPPCVLQDPRWFGHCNIWWRVQIMKLLIMQFSPVSLGANIVLRILFSNTLNVCSSVIVRDQVPHPRILYNEVRYTWSKIVYIRKKPDEHLFQS